MAARVKDWIAGTLGSGYRPDLQKHALIVDVDDGHFAIRARGHGVPRSTSVRRDQGDRDGPDHESRELRERPAGPAGLRDGWGSRPPEGFPHGRLPPDSDYSTGVPATRAVAKEMAEFWPTSDDAYAAPMNDIPKVVFSRTLERAEWANSRIAHGDLADEIAALKRGTAKDMIAWGGAAFAQSLSRLGVVDEYRSSCDRWHSGRASSLQGHHRAAPARTPGRADLQDRRCASRLLSATSDFGTEPTSVA